MIKKSIKILACFTVSFIFLSACGHSSQDLGYQDGAGIQEGRTKPKLPSGAEGRKPKLPLKASVLDAFEKKPSLPDETKIILAEIDKDVRRLNITRDDILRGWYYGPEKDKKYGTPDGWVWIEDGETSRWVSPEFLDKQYHEKKRKLCSETGGFYVVSCMESEAPDCKYVQETGCSCPEKMRWDDEGGCIPKPDLPSLPNESTASE